MKKYTPKSEKWFKKRIGKRIYRDPVDCCFYCGDIADNGLTVQDDFHAAHLAATDSDFGAEGTFLNYRDKL